jgi:hypothetical protein
MALTAAAMLHLATHIQKVEQGIWQHQGYLPTCNLQLLAGWSELVLELSQA